MPVLNCNANTMAAIPCRFNNFLHEVDERQCLFWYMWQLAHTITSQKCDFGERGSLKDKCFVHYQRKSFASFLVKSWFCPVLACVATCISVQTKINQTAQLDQLKGIRSSMTRIVPPPPPPFISSLFVVQLPPNLAWQFSESKSLKGRKSQIHKDVTYDVHDVHLCSDEYRKLLTTVYIRAGAASSTFIWSYSNLAETFSTNTAFDWKCWIWINRCFSCSDDVITIILTFWQINTVQSLIFQLSFKNLLFWRRLWKVCYSWDIY